MASPATSDETAAAALSAIDRGWDAVVDVLDLPPPEGPAGEPWEVYVTPAPRGGEGAFFVDRDPRARFDRGSSFAVLDATDGAGCAMEHAAARAVARGSLWRTAPATDEATAVAQSEAVARLATPCASSEEDDDDRAFQAAPERSVGDRTSPAFERGAAAFYGWLDGRFGARPGAVIAASWALAPTRTTRDAWRAGRWAPSPSPFEVLRVSLADALWKGSTVDDVLGAFAVARATPPIAPPGPELSWLVDWPAHARRLASPRPVAPGGASYVVVDHRGAPAGARLRLEAAWEDYGRMHWTAIKVGADGSTLATIPVASADRATQAAITVEELDGVDHVVVVGVNVGSTERPFRPAQGEWEPHGWTLTIEAE